MVRHRDLLPLVLTGLVVTAGAIAGVGVATDAQAPLPLSVEPAPDRVDLGRLVTVAEGTLAAAREQVRSLTAPLQPFLEHPTELLLVFELGLLVEHLRLLNRVDENLADRIDQVPADHGEEPSERRR